MTKKHAHSLGIRLPRFHEGWVHAVSAAVFLSGALWLVFHHFMAGEGPLGPELHPGEAWSLKLHGAAAMAFLVLLGTLVPVHMYRNWRIGKNVISAVALLVPLLTLIATGYGLYYAGDEGFRAVLVDIHWVLGLAAAVPYLLHVFIGKRKRPVV